jgi:hypothetical protein
MAGLEVLVALEVAVALDEAEAARVVETKGVHRERPGIVERAPDPLAGAGGEEQPVGVVHLGPEVLGGLDVFSP